MKTYRFKQLDVFADQPLLGNPLAVVLGADGIDEQTMRRFARWTNLSETTFVSQPTDSAADYQVRILTPSTELPFAGHPTLGSCYAWLANNGRPKAPDVIVQQCAIGLVTIRRDDNRLAFLAPPLLKNEPLDNDALSTICRGLGVAPADVVAHRLVDNGNRWHCVLLRSAAQVLSLQPDYQQLRRHKVGVIGPYAKGAGADYEVRAFVAPYGIQEDPVTGSLHAAIAGWCIGAGIADGHYLASQGTVLQRQGRVYVNSDTDGIWIGGAVTQCIDGTMTC